MGLGLTGKPGRCMAGARVHGNDDVVEGGGL